MNKEEKERIVSNLKEKFSEAKAIVFTNFKGLTVAEVSDLRRSLKESDVEYKVVKNTLARLALVGTVVETAKDVFSGPIGLAIGYDDPLIAPKKVLEFSSDIDKLQVLSGFIDGQVLPLDNLKKISKLPPRNVLLSMFAGAMVSPLNRMAVALNATLNRFIYALNALKEKKEKT